MSCDQHNSILQGLINRDLKSLELLYREYSELLRFKAKSLVQDETIASDIVHDLFIKIWEKELYLNVKTSLGSYLFIAVHNACLDHLSKNERERLKMEGYSQSFLEIDIVVDLTQRDLMEGQLVTCRLYDEASEELSTNQQAVVKKVFEEDKTYKQVALEMGISKNSVRKHLERAYEKFRAKFLDKNCRPYL